MSEILKLDNESCGMCLQKNQSLKETRTLFTKRICDVLQKCCDFLFLNNGDCLIEYICNNCWESINQFDTFCESVRNAHGFTQIFDESTKDNPTEEYGEEFLTNDDDDNVVIADPLNVGKNVEKNLSLARRSFPMTINVVRSLQNQLRFQAIRIRFDDLDFNKVSRFINIGCCEQTFQSFDEVHSHSLDEHNRPAKWMCCNIDLESPYDIYDHIRYHESIDDFRCAACSKCFLTSTKLKFHIRRNHLPIENDAYICPICKKDCKNQRLLLNHEKNHISVDCPYCEKTIYAVYYMSHVRQHTVSNSGKLLARNEIHHPIKKQKMSTKKTSNAKGVSSAKTKSPTRKKAQTTRKVDKHETKTCTLSIEQNEDGKFECDVCKMLFDQISTVLIHRNKVHV